MPPRAPSIVRNIPTSRGRIAAHYNATTNSTPSAASRYLKRSIFTASANPVRGGRYSAALFARTAQQQYFQHNSCVSNLPRAFSTTATMRHGDLTPPKPGEELHVTFETKEGHSFTFEVAEGDNLLDIAQAHDLEMEGACGGSCACSTCHVIVEDQDKYDLLEEPDDDENDMLDLAFGLTETSRLGCQVKMTKEIDGLKVRLPAMTRNLQASDFK
ncbi:hypothetical protein H072_8589 [Dactylellina haptotyla CBS 200.50]|uniref:2Fe-2S ferredoxin-type domain-containing protein n=1 Tax=Dactylellina haptotyla (strain CBS 200.50) TaxID=1284197 RepID=S8BR27_DACHA|nr:hypothetical protein H072_8589 [Dactylellina haptotyla CBS 200.50]